MSFFINDFYSLGDKLLEVIYMVMGLISIYVGIKNARDKENPAPISTAFFWCSLGVVLAFGRWILPIANGVIIVIMTLPAMLKKVKTGKKHLPDENHSKYMSNKLGLKIFIPALSIGIFAIFFAILTTLGAIVGLGVGILVAIIILMFYSPKNKPNVFLLDCERLLSTIGPLCMLPMLLASLGAIFTEAGVGDVIASFVGKIIPEGNVNLGIIFYAVGMMVFTMIMGNSYASITVMTAGIGAPFVLAYGANPVVIVMVALTCGACGTLSTPMAANFNIVPVAMLGMKDKFGVIKNQVLLAMIFLVFQIAFMIAFK